jgi:hypothetical protein
MGEERKVRFDQSLPGELALIAAFALFFILIAGLLLGWGRRYERSRQGDQVELLSRISHTPRQWPGGKEE